MQAAVRGPRRPRAGVGWLVMVALTVGGIAFSVWAGMALFVVVFVLMSLFCGIRAFAAFMGIRGFRERAQPQL